MAWEFGAKCDDCDHQWDALLINERIGHHNTDSHRYFCPHCFVHLLIAPDLDRLTFPKWLNANQRSVSDSPVLQHTVSLINEVLTSSSGLLIPHSLYASRLACTSCDCRLTKGTIDDAKFFCEKCGLESARSTDVHSHVSLARVEDLEDQT